MDEDEENAFNDLNDIGIWGKDSIHLRDLDSGLNSDIENFVNSEDEYNRFGIPYKLTFLLTGIPGSGKTSLIKAICKKFKFNLYMLSFSKKFDNNSLIHAIKNIESESILLIEDIDCLFNKRTSTDDTMISFSNLLNVLDGILYKHGSIIFLTTNHPEKLDHALIRIGRIDNIFELNYPSKNDIKNLFFDLIKSDNSEFDLFYDYINDTKICMSAIVNFLFKHRKDWSSHIDELLNTNNLITRILGNENKNLLFSYILILYNFIYYIIITFYYVNDAIMPFLLVRRIFYSYDNINLIDSRC
jgi:SpoVK/Ycf46/Vps4 family AAA+-type ATPase